MSASPPPSIDVVAFLRPLVELRAAAPEDLACLHGGRVQYKALERDGLIRIIHVESRLLFALGPATRAFFPHLPRGAFYGPISVATAVHGWTRAALRAAHVRDGWTVDNTNVARDVLRRDLVSRAHEKMQELDRSPHFRSGMAKGEARLAIPALESLPELQPADEGLPWDVAWRQNGAEQETRIIFVEQPFQALKRQLGTLPLQILGQPRVRIVLRPAEDGSVVDQEGRPLVRGARWRSLLRAFTPTTRPMAGYPLWTTADVVNYRPEVFFRVMRG